MADTIYYNAQGEVIPYDSLPAEMKEALEHLPPSNSKQEGEDYALYVWIFFIGLAFILVRRALKAKGTTVLKGWHDGRHSTIDKNYEDVLKDYHVYRGSDLLFTDELYEKTLSKRCPYYQRLAPELKDKFLRRTKKFLADKTFLIKSDEPFVEMPVLLSATAVQLSFGLDQYMLPHYQYIRVYEQEYFAKGSLRILAGHVYGNTITVAWNHLLKGHEEYNDGVNLGLHEIAHAIYFQLVEADHGRCREFTSLFDQILAEGTEVHQSKHNRSSQIYSENAYRNLQEFWAELVELFFERPAALRKENSDLYEIMKDILNQDPVHALYPVIPT